MDNAVGLPEAGDDEIISVHIDIVGEHVQGSDRGIFGNGESVRHRHRRVGERVDGDGYRSHAGFEEAVTGLVGETVTAVVIDLRRIGE